MPNLYPTHAIGSGLWADYEDTYIEGPDMVFWGAQVGWSPRREWQGEIGCKTCNGVIVFNALDHTLAVPIEIRRLTSEQLQDFAMVVPENDLIGDGICASCMRWSKDNELSLLMEREFLTRGSNEPIQVEIPEGGTVPIRSDYLK